MSKVSCNELSETCGNPIVVISHPRSGTHLTIDLLRKQFSECASYKWPFERHDFLYFAIEGFLHKDPRKRLKEKTALKIVRRAERPIIKLHTYSWDILHDRCPEWMQWINESGKKIYVSRDVRSVLVSFYFYAKTFSDSADVPISDFIRQPFCGRRSRPAYWKEMMQTWRNKEGILQLEYDDIVDNPGITLKKIGQFLNLAPIMNQPFLPRNLKSVSKYRWQRLFSVRPESTTILGAFSTTKPKRQEVFNADDLRFIEEEIAKTINAW